jgi:Gnt-I system high-affinity gluconate transporter
MPLIYVAVGILLMLVLLLWLKFDAFFSLLITSFVVGLLNGMPAGTVLDSVLAGIGHTMGNIVLILVFGAMLGKLVEESGAAHTITDRLTEHFGLKNIQYAILITGLLVGLPMMYNASFLVLIPLIYTLSVSTRLPLIHLGIPLSAALSIAHGYLPPHPAPTYVSLVFGADINKALLVGLVPVLPACLLAGILLSRFFRQVKTNPPAHLFAGVEFAPGELPGLGRSLLVILSPVLLMLCGAALDLFFGPEADYSHVLAGTDVGGAGTSILTGLFGLIKFLSDPNIALFAAVLLGIPLLGLRKGKAMAELMGSLGKSVGAIAMIVMIIAAGGAFSQVLKDGGVSEYIGAVAADMRFNPMLVGFSVAALIRLAVGSATVATMTAAGIVLPLAQQSGIAPELMVLATGSGSLLFSHFNDIGFWMFKEYYNVSIRHTFAIWTVMETIVGVVGLMTALLLNAIFGT